MAIDLLNFPTKATPFISEGFKVHHVGDATEALNLVVVNNRYEIIKVMMRGKENGLPC